MSDENVTKTAITTRHEQASHAALADMRKVARLKDDPHTLADKKGENNVH